MRLSIMNLEGLDEVEGELAGEGVNTAESKAAVATEFVDGPEAAMAEVETEADDIEGLLEDGEKAEAVADKVGEMKEGLEKVVAEDGGLTESTAEVVTVALEALRISIGMGPMNKALVPSFESFRDKTTAAESTHLIMEGFTDTIKRIWAALVNMVSVIKEKIKAFFAAMFDAAERTRQRAVKLAAVAKSRSGGKAASDVKVKLNGGVLNVDGTIVTGSAFIGKLNEHYKTTQIGAQNQILASFKEGGQHLIKAVSFINDEEKCNDELWEAMSKLSKTAENEVGKKFVFGQVGVVAVAYEGLIAKVKPVSISIKKIEGAKEVKSEEVTPLSADEAYKACNAMSEHLAGYKTVTEVTKRVNEIMDSVTAAAKAGAAAASKAKDEKGAAAANVIRKASSQFLTNTNMIVTSLRRYDLQVTGAALDYIANSLKESKGKGDGKPENLLPAPDKS